MSKLIWDSIFAKPAPIAGVGNWNNSPESDNYVYFPNDCKRMKDNLEFKVNASYTQVMTLAYNRMCKQLKVRPHVRLWNGELIDASEVTGMSGMQPVEHEEVARLANSHLVDYDDSGHVELFLKIMEEINDEELVDGRPVKVRVLAKCESILLGHSLHVYNHLLIKRITPLIPPLLFSKVMDVLQSLASKGNILSESQELLRQTCVLAGLSNDWEVIRKAYLHALERDIE